MLEIGEIKMKKMFTLGELISFIPEHQATNKEKVDALIEHFNSNKFGRIIVSKNGSKYIILDGTIRVQALQKMNFTMNYEIKCDII